MKRIPVTSKKASAYDNKHDGEGQAKTVKAAFGGMNIGFNATSGIGTINTSAYRNSYANMGVSAGNCGDIPTYFQILNENNGGIFYWPVTLKEKYEWYRYFSRTDPFVKQAVELHTDLPMSKLVLRMPKMNNEKLRDKILRKYEDMVKRIKLFERLHSILYEMNVIGNCFIFAEFDEERREWSKLVILPPEEIMISKYPMSDEAKVQYKPEILNSLMKRYTIPLGSEEDYAEFVDSLEGDEKAVLCNVPYEFALQLNDNNGVLTMDTDPFTGDGEHKIGSFVSHLSEKRHEYYDLGTSPLESVLIPLLMKEIYKYTQVSLASRNMTPRNKISAPDVGQEALEQLRYEVDMSMLNPDYTIVTNYDWNWEQIGAENRLIDLSREYAVIEEQFFAGLGITKELLTGEGMYSGSKISVELLNTKYLFKREKLQNYVENELFLPMAEENGFYEVDDDGNKTYFYPRLSFTRLSIRDNTEVFDSLFQLYQKGSLPIDVILDLFNLDADEIHEKLKNDMFTVKDCTFNDMVRSILGDVASRIVEETDIAKKMKDYLRGPDGEKLNDVGEEEGEEDDSDGYGYEDRGDFNSEGYGDEDEDRGDFNSDDHGADEDVTVEEADGASSTDADGGTGEGELDGGDTGEVAVGEEPLDPGAGADADDDLAELFGTPSQFAKSSSVKEDVAGKKRGNERKVGKKREKGTEK